MKLFKTLLATLFCTILVTGALNAVNAEAATGPNTGSASSAYIMVIEDDSCYYIYDGISSVNRQYFQPSSGSKVDGVTYDKATNTLTLDNCKVSHIDVNEMGDDFTVKLVGTNKVTYLQVWGYGYGGCLTIGGTGTLNGELIILQAEDTKTKFTVKDSATVKLAPGADTDGYFPFAIIDTLLDKDVINAKYEGKLESEKNFVAKQELLTDPDGATYYFDKLTKDGKAYYVLATYGMDAYGNLYIAQYDVYSGTSGSLTQVGTYANTDDIISAGYKYDVKYYKYSYAILDAKGVTFTAGTATEDTAKDTAKAPAKGDVITANGARYTVTKAATKDTYGTVSFKAPKSGATSVSIPATVTVDGYKYKVTSIAASAFSGNKTVTSVTIGKYVKTVGKKAFYNCSNLTAIKVSSTKFTSTSVKSYSFKGVSSKCVVTVPASKKDAYTTILKKAGLSTKATIK